MDLSKVKALTIPDGVVTQIAYARGRMSWKAAPTTAMVTVTNGDSDGQYWWTYCYATLPDSSRVSLGSVGTYELPIGTIIHCEGGSYFSQSSSARMRIYLNEQVVAATQYSDELNYISSCSYEYTLNGNITLDPRQDKGFDYDSTVQKVRGAIYITEIPEGQIMFTVNGTNYFADEGMTWTEWFDSSYNTTGETEGNITDANGNEVSMDAVIIGGTAYEVVFGPETVTITITGYWPGGTGVSIDDNPASAYSSPYEVPYGAVVACSNNGYSSEVREKESWISHNGSIVVDGLGTYSFIATKNTTINMDSWRSDYGTYSVPIEITEE